MSNAQDIGQKVQDQTLDAVRKTQNAVVEAVTAWTETNDARTPGDFTRQFPTVAEFIDFNFDFAQRILSSQRDFAHRIIAATTPKAEASKAKAATPKAVKALAPAKKSAPAKTRTTAKKATAVRQRRTAAK